MHRSGWVVMLVATGAFAARAGNAEWTSSGPLGGRVHEIVFDPTDANRAYATTFGGVFRSGDGGVHWSSAAAGIVADSQNPLPLVIDAEQPVQLYTFDSWSRIYRSDNRGDNWAILPENPSSDIHPATLADRPGSTCALLLGTATDAPPQGPMLFASDDCAISFRQVGIGLPGDVPVKAIAFDPADAGHLTVLVGLDGDPNSEGNSIYRSNDGGEHFSALPSNFSPGSGSRPEVTRIVFGPAGDLWAVVGGYSVFHSDDGGNNWRDSGAYGVSTVVADPVVAGRAWAGGAAGVARIDYTLPSYVVTPFNAGLTPNPTYTDGSIAIPAGVARLAWRGGSTPRLFASTEGAGLFELGALGPAQWSAVVNAPAGAAIHALAVHPLVPQRLWAGQATFSVSSPAFHVSNDAGSTWNASNVGLAAADIQAIAIDPNTTASVLATTLYAAGRASNSFNDAFRNHAIFRSDDGGQTFSLLEASLPGVANFDIGAARSIAVDARTCATPPCSLRSGASNRVYVAGFGRTQVDTGSIDTSHRLLRSDDRGASWVVLDGNPGFPRSNRVFAAGTLALEQRVTPTVVTADPANADTVFVGTESDFFDFNTGDAITIDGTRASGLFRSADAGATWQRFGNLPAKLDANDLPYPNASLDVVDFLIDPSNSNVFWIALYDPSHAQTSTILRSADRGANWQVADQGINASLQLRDLAFDPQNPNVLYAAAGGNGANPGAIYRGVFDTGTQSMRWLSISIGLPAESAYVVAVDPSNPNQIYAGTDTGVHAITREPDQDGDGVPDSIENQAPDVPGGIVGPGDGNGDGVPDAAQRDVGSSVIIYRGDGTSSAITSSIVSGSGPGTSPCSQAVDVRAIAPGELTVDVDPDSGRDIDHPLPARQFDIVECAAAVVDITYHGADFRLPGWSFRLFGPADPGELDRVGWFEPASAQRVGQATWRLPLAAQGPGSYRPEPDAIRFVGAPACIDARLFADGLETLPTQVPWCSP